MSDIREVGVVGSGAMGQGIAQVFAQSGFKVLVYDSLDGAVERATGRIEKALNRQVEKGKLDTDSVKKTMTFGWLKGSLVE